jgi:hypothetical protein
LRLCGLRACAAAGQAVFHDYWLYLCVYCCIAYSDFIQTFIISSLHFMSGWNVSKGLHPACYCSIYDYTPRLHLEPRSEQKRQRRTHTTHMTPTIYKQSFSAVKRYVWCIFERTKTSIKAHTIRLIVFRHSTSVRPHTPEQAGSSSFMYYKAFVSRLSPNRRTSPDRRFCTTMTLHTKMSLAQHEHTFPAARTQHTSP